MKELKRLLGVRTIITLSLTATLIYGFVVGKVETKDFLVYLAMAFAYFFAKENIKAFQEEQQEQQEMKGGN